MANYSKSELLSKAEQLERDHPSCVDAAVGKLEDLCKSRLAHWVIRCIHEAA